MARAALDERRANDSRVASKGELKQLGERTRRRWRAEERRRSKSGQDSDQVRQEYGRRLVRAWRQLQRLCVLLGSLVRHSDAVIGRAI
jgi:hypothetical protein